MSPDKATAKRMTGKYKDLIFGFANRQISVQHA